MPQKDTDDDGPDPVGRALFELGGWVSERLAGEDGREAWENGTEQLAPDATPSEIGNAILQGGRAAIELNEQRRRLREAHEQGAPPALSTARIENEAGDLTGVRVIVSDPSAELYLGGEHVMVSVEDRVIERVGLPFQPGTLEDTGQDGVTEVVVRPTAAAGKELPEFEVLVIANNVIREYPGRAFAAVMYGDDEAREALTGIVATRVEDDDVTVNEVQDALDVALERTDPVDLEVSLEE